MRSLIRLFKQQLKRGYLSLRGLRADAKQPVLSIKSGKQEWYIVQNSLQPGDVVYSLGLADNIEFDLNLIQAFGVEVHGFDPTPASVSWIQSQKLPEQFHFYPTAVAGIDGGMAFEQSSLPGRHWQAITGPEAEASGVSMTLPCRRLETLMREFGHQKIDLLKMDIEGSEYAVIEDMLQSRLEVRQILVEFHHRFPGIGLSKTQNAISSLREAGYRLVHISPWCEEFVFLRS